MAAYICNYPFLRETVKTVVAFAGLSQTSAERVEKLLPSFLLEQESCLQPEPGLFDPQGDLPANRFLLAPKVGKEVERQLKSLVAIERCAASNLDTRSAKMARSILDSLPRTGIENLFQQIKHWREQDGKERKSARETRPCVSAQTFTWRSVTFSRITTSRELQLVGAKLRVCLAQEGFREDYAKQLRRREADFWVFGKANGGSPTGVLSVNLLKGTVSEAVTRENGSLPPAMAQPVHAFCKAYGYAGGCDALVDLGLLGEHARSAHHRLARGVWYQCPYLVTEARGQLRVQVRHGDVVYHAYYDARRGGRLDCGFATHELSRADAVRVLLHAVANADAPADVLRRAADRISERRRPDLIMVRVDDDVEAVPGPMRVFADDDVEPAG